jgi:hypothetical protein
VGELIATQESRRVETGGGALWFEMMGYRRADELICIVIRAQRRDWDSKHVVEHTSVESKAEVLRFVRSFDPERTIASKVLATPDEPDHRQLIDEATDAYYATSRRFIKKLEKPLSQFGHGRAELDRAARQRDEEHASKPNVLNRVRSWLTPK